MCEYCDHETNEEAKRFPLFNENAKREEAFIDEDNKQIRHQKYKRCLAMAKVCFLRFVRYENYLQKLCASNATIEAYKFRMDMYDKWEKRWFKLAKKFKDKEA